MTPSPLPLNPHVVLGIAAHPDDLDFGAAGTMATFAAQGADVYYLILTDGSKGTDDRSLTSMDLITIRQKEQRAAVQAIGGKGVTFLDYPDGQLEISMTLKRDIVRELRRIKPDVVITMDPSVLYDENRGIINHPDHRAAGQAALDAVFPLARDHLSFPELLEEGLEPHKTPTVLLTNFTRQSFFVDISQTFEQKIAALSAHQSQIKDIDQVRSWLDHLSSQLGAKAGVARAEGFIRLDIS